MVEAKCIFFAAFYGNLVYAKYRLNAVNAVKINFLIYVKLLGDCISYNRLLGGKLLKIGFPIHVHAAGCSLYIEFVPIF